ncbi:MAG: tetratricopeptide repeat protein [Proteobacteria bacterium]|nr:tetratricopeptide repeat protein [Pseudomonadota bacterium]
MSEPDLQALIQKAAALHQAGRLSEAETLYRKALAADPENFDANHLLGIVLSQTGDLDAGIERLQKATAINSGLSEAWTNLGNALYKAGRVEDAENAFRRTLALDPVNLQALIPLSNALMALNKPEEAADHYRKALAIAPDSADVLNNLGNALQDLEQFEDAIDSYGQALAINPENADTWCNQGNAHLKLGRLTEAETNYRKALTRKPDYVEALNNLGNAMQNLGRIDEAVDSYHQALAIDPDYIPTHSNLLVTMPFLPRFSAAEVFAASKRAGATIEASIIGQTPLRHLNSPDPDRPLNIGYLSPSMSMHVLAPYMEPVLQAHRRDRVSVHVYAHVPNPDETTLRLKRLADHWTFVHAMSDDQLAGKIIGDGIDILVDPMGHWDSNRLTVLARKPAPIQVSYLCQNMTSGLSAMDYIIADRWLNEGGAMQAFATEQVVELASGFQVTSYTAETPITVPPSSANGFITFSSFNNPAKISDRCLGLWARVMARLPTARLLIKGQWLDLDVKRAIFLQRLDDHGIPAGRVDLRGFIPGPDHLSAHNLCDIALDTAPFTGGRTTVDALWMGVPVVSLIGDTVTGRFSYSHLARVGVPELAAQSEDEYVEIAVALAEDSGRLGTYRRTLRESLRASPLFDAALHAGELEDAFRVMWRRWCEG